jgi:hypothetical protein
VGSDSMSVMRRRAALSILLLLATGAAASVPPAARLTHRVWLLGGVPEGYVLDALRSAGVASVAVPVGNVQLSAGDARFSPSPLSDLGALAGWSVTPIVWIAGDGEAAGDAEVFAVQLGPTLSAVPGRSGLLLAARQFAPGIPKFAAALARRLGQPVELCMAAQDLGANLPPGGWPNVLPVAVAGGLPASLGFPASLTADDEKALTAIDRSGTAYRFAVVIMPRISPAPASGSADLAALCFGDVANYKPGSWGDLFVLRRPVDWGGARLAAGESVEVAFMDMARYHRDLGTFMRPVREGLRGWDTVGLPGPEPTIGISRRGLLDYFAGGPSWPVPEIESAWTSSTTLRVTLVNPTPHCSAIGSTATSVELQFSGSEVRDIQLGQFTGTEYGRYQGKSWRRTAAREATAVRLYVLFLPPNARVSGGTVDFLTRPREIEGRWSVRLGDGRDVVGSPVAIPVTRP